MRRQCYKKTDRGNRSVLLNMLCYYVKAIPHKDCATDASSDFLRDEGKNGENPLWIFEYFPEISRKICTQDACEKMRNRL